MRRVLAVFFAICIFISTLTVSKQVWAVSEDFVSEGEIELLGKLGLLPEGFENDLAKTATRAQAAEILALFYEKTESDTPQFEDIDPKSSVGEAISTLCEHKIVNGNENGAFLPDAYIAANELICMGVRALGGEVYAKNNGGYPLGYRKAATSVFGLRTSFSEKITVGELLAFVLELADTEIMEQKGFGRAVTYEIADGETLLKVQKGIKKLSGVLDANRYTGLNSAAAKTEGGVSVDGVLLRSTDQKNDELIGYRVDAYYMENNGIKTAVAVSADKNRNRELVLSGGSGLAYSNNTYEYYNENGRQKTAAIGGSAFAFIYNGVACEKYESEFFAPDNGTVTLIDNNDDGVYNVVLVKSYQSFAVESVSADALVLKDGGNLLLKSTKTDYYFRKSDGTEIKPTDLSNSYVVSVFKSENGEIVNVICESREITGIAEKIKSVSGETFWVIDSHEYRVVKRLAGTAALEAGMRITARLDCFGDIADVSLWEGEYYFYAYLGKCGEDTGIAKNLIFAMYDSDGTVRMTEGASKITIDGKMCRSYSEVIKQLKTAAIYSDRFLADPLSSVSYAITDEEFAQRGPEQFVRYRLSAEGKVCIIDTAAPEMGDDYSKTLHMSSLNEGTAQKTAVPQLSMLGRSLAYGDDTLFFWVPKDYSKRDKFFAEYSGKSLVDKVKYDAVGFYTDDSLVADYITIITEDNTSVTPGDWSRMYVVSEKLKSVNEDGETINIISYFENYNSGLKEYTAEENTAGLLDSVDEGDIIRCGLYNGKIAGFELIYDYDKQKFSGITGEYFEYPHIFAGTAYVSKGNIVAITGENPLEGSISVSECNLYNVSKYPITTVESGRELLIRSGSAADIKSFSEFGAEASKIIVHMVGGTPITMVVVN